MELTCSRCGQSSFVPDDLVRGRAFRARCPDCGSLVEVAAHPPVALEAGEPRRASVRSVAERARASGPVPSVPPAVPLQAPPMAVPQVPAEMSPPVAPRVDAAARETAARETTARETTARETTAAAAPPVPAPPAPSVAPPLPTDAAPPPAPRIAGPPPVAPEVAWREVARRVRMARSARRRGIAVALAGSALIATALAAVVLKVVAR